MFLHLTFLTCFSLLQLQYTRVDIVSFIGSCRLSVKLFSVPLFLFQKCVSNSVARSLRVSSLYVWSSVECFLPVSRDLKFYFFSSVAVPTINKHLHRYWSLIPANTKPTINRCVSHFIGRKQLSILETIPCENQPPLLFILSQRSTKICATFFYVRFKLGLYKNIYWFMHCKSSKWR